MSFDDLSSKLNEASGGSKNYDDERVWYPKTDDVGNGYAVIRFLPASENDELPFVQMYAHGFKGGTGKWYFENCPTTLNNDCPVCAANREIVESHGGWESTPKDVKDGVIRNRKRKMNYYSNIYVVSDPETPENEGKVFLFKYGKKIMDKLQSAAAPEFKDETAIQPFDFWDGANFKLKIRKVDRQTNYDSSSFEDPSQLLPTDKEMEKVYKQEYTLSDLIAADKFKEMDDLQKNFNRVEGNTTAAKPSVDESLDEPAPVDKIAEKPVFGGKKDKADEPKETPVVEASSNDDDDDALSYFASLAES